MGEETKRKRVRTWVLRGSVSKIHKGVKPLTRINVKPYTIILRNGKILCGGERQVPLVFDTKALAMGYLEANSMNISECQLPEMDLEELAHVCRDPKINFSSFYLIDDVSQINPD